MYKLLIADDEYEIRNGLSNYFPWGDVGFTVVSQADNGTQVMAYTERHEVDVILCDIRMPNMTGIDVARELYLKKSPIKVIFLSGYKDFEFAQQALIYGVKNYIVKPTKYDELMNVFLSIKEELNQEKKTDAAQEGGVSDKVISVIKNYVKERYRDAALDGAADLVHMSPYYISKYFKQKTGENFSDYVISVKMEKAAQFLKEIDYKTYEISEMIGYSNPKNFTRTFKKYFGKSPREFRNAE
ncbi:response regulator [Paenibacillus alginolyticus]|uniref:Response regulator n=1 Tax=Paenibacillus alginolyticus TaxID=59839 RepID=A0ABT4GMC1_9BACL|nr:response regulator [Paenibacillus alginolyticus]MCY9670142.1 response regulator [Paenibacillus alginolyticus]MCY9697358.1 response regulator [Paenibacillus alginolyticus]MEC0146206.1 response regulator [Paenibacillus alginolyticus]